MSDGVGVVVGADGAAVEVQAQTRDVEKVLISQDVDGGFIMVVLDFLVEAAGLPEVFVGLVVKRGGFSGDLMRCEKKCWRWCWGAGDVDDGAFFDVAGEGELVDDVAQLRTDLQKVAVR